MFRSIKWRLQAWQMLLLAAVLAVLLALHYQLRRKELVAQVDKQLRDALVIVLPVVAPPPSALPPRREPQQLPPPLADGPEQIGQDFIEQIADHDYYVMAWNAAGAEEARHGSVPADLALPDPPPAAGKQVIATRAGNRELVRHQPNGVVILVGQPLAPVYRILAATRIHLLAVGLAVMATGFAGGWLIIARVMRPLREIGQTARRIASGERNRRIELADAPVELEDMACTLNETFDHLDDAIETQKRFSADASHELRTPIAVVIAQTQAALRRDRSTEEYKAVLEACLRAGQRMKTMANSLLELNRVERIDAELLKGRHDLNTLLHETATSTALLSDLHPVEFKAAAEALWADVDGERIQQVAANLVANALQHNPDGCPIRVELRRNGGKAEIEVADGGAGIAPEHLPHLFERFFRVDKSRSREHGGAGLGLAIAKGIVEAHGGTIAVSSMPGQGTTFTIELPLA